MYEKNALNNFKDVLGKYCAINQLIELSKRCFVAEHQKEIQKRDIFVKLATEYSITLTNYDAANIYIVTGDTDMRKSIDGLQRLHL